MSQAGRHGREVAFGRYDGRHVAERRRGRVGRAVAAAAGTVLAAVVLAAGVSAHDAGAAVRHRGGPVRAVFHCPAGTDPGHGRCVAS